MPLHYSRNEPWLIFCLVLVLVLVILLLDWRNWRCQVMIIILIIIILLILSRWDSSRSHNTHPHERRLRILCKNTGIRHDYKIIPSNEFGYDDDTIFIPLSVSRGEFMAMGAHGLSHIITKNTEHDEFFHNTYRFLMSKKDTAW